MLTHRSHKPQSSHLDNCNRLSRCCGGRDQLGSRSASPSRELRKVAATPAVASVSTMTSPRYLQLSLHRGVRSLRSSTWRHQRPVHLNTWRACQELPSSSYTSSHPLLLPSFGACCLIWVSGAIISCADIELTLQIAKCFVMALLYLKDPLPTVDLEVWVKLESKK